MTNLELKEMDPRLLLQIRLRVAALFATFLFCSACFVGTTDPVGGPDKQGSGLFTGAAVGAGAGAIMGHNLGGGGNSGPGAWVGAGMGALYGMLSGLGIDLLEESQISRMDEEQYLREVAWAQELLAEHYQRRIELHPNRDIFPADWFFFADETKLKAGSAPLVSELAAMTRQRMPWSRIVIASYVTTSDLSSEYARYLSTRRAENIALAFVRLGIEPRRLYTRGVAVPDPILSDPHDGSDRYRQAIEIIPLDF